jgi:hypothetical protein
MDQSPPSLHPPVLETEAHKDLLRQKLSIIAGQRSGAQKRPILAGAPAVRISLSTVSLATSFDAYVSISYPGADENFSVSLLVDSGNSSLIVPNFSDLAGLPSFSNNYTVLQYGVREPWGCPACIVKGPIRLFAEDGIYDVPNCVFYACLGPNDSGELTANFGVGCLGLPKVGDEIQPPLAFIDDYRRAEFDYAPAAQRFAAKGSLMISGGSFLTLYKDVPNNYKMFDIVKNQEWMSLRPKSLSIGNVLTKWPGDLALESIAMIDTGGGPVFLSDPKDHVWPSDWPRPAPVPPPSWLDGEYSCQAIAESLSITLSDEKSSFSYRIDRAKLPASVQGLTLVMCKHCHFMMSQNGMNIGGLSALFNYILIDYASAKVGFKSKPPELL